MNANDVSQAVAGAIGAGGEQMLENTVSVLLPVLWLAVVALHLARPYMLHMIPRFTLRLAADIWWILYVAVRDITIATTFVLSIMFLFPDVVNADPLPITGGLAAVCLFAVLVLKLVRDADEDRGTFILTGNLLGLGAALYLVPTVLGLQATGAAASGFWGDLANAMTTNTDPNLAVALSYVSAALVTVLGIYAVVYSTRQTISPARPDAA